MGNADVLMKDIAGIIESSNPSCGTKKECETKCGECGAERIKARVNDWLKEKGAIHNVLVEKERATLWVKVPLRLE